MATWGGGDDADGRDLDAVSPEDPPAWPIPVDPDTGSGSGGGPVEARGVASTGRHGDSRIDRGNTVRVAPLQYLTSPEFPMVCRFCRRPVNEQLRTPAGGKGCPARNRVLGLFRRRHDPQPESTTTARRWSPAVTGVLALALGTALVVVIGLMVASAP